MTLLIAALWATLWQAGVLYVIVCWFELVKNWGENRQEKEAE